MRDLHTGDSVEMGSGPLTVHLIGAQKSNYPWGFENRLIPVFESMNVRLISTDFRQERERLEVRIAQPADFILVCKGDLIPPGLIEQAPCPTALWWIPSGSMPTPHRRIPFFLPMFAQPEHRASRWSPANPMAVGEW